MLRGGGDLMEGKGKIRDIFDVFWTHFVKKTTNPREDILVSSYASISLVSKYVSNFYVAFLVQELQSK